jgi:hypothetical protein
MRRAVPCLMVTAGLLAGCGLREPLAPPPGGSLPPTPFAAERPLTTQELLAVPTEMRPLRVDEVLTRSEPRPSDRFDLPPPDLVGEAGPDISELEERPEPATDIPQR